MYSNPNGSFIQNIQSTLLDHALKQVIFALDYVYRKMRYAEWTEHKTSPIPHSSWTIFFPVQILYPKDNTKETQNV